MKKKILLCMICLCVSMLIPFSCECKTKSFTLSAAGDCTLAKDIAQPTSVSLPTVYSKKGAAYFLKKVQKVFGKDDLTLVNFEGTLSNRGTRASKKWAFRGKPSYINILKKGSVEAVSLSNNHSSDYGAVSRSDTMALLKKAKIAYTTETSTAIRKVNGFRVGLVSISSIEVGYRPVATLVNAMKQVKKKKPDVIIVSMHSGIEYTQDLQPIQKTLGHTAINLGADVVIGHHPHVMQGIESYKGKYILYSLGNFCFGGNTNPPDKDAFMFQMTFSLKKGKVSRKAPTVIPVRISGSDGINNYQPVISQGKQKQRIIKRLNHYSDKTGVTIDSKGKMRAS